MIKGFFIENIPFIPIIVAWGQSVQFPVFVLDTGFTGDLLVTPAIAKKLGLVNIAVTPVEIADGRKVNMRSALALASLEGTVNHIEVLISDGKPLAGISLLSKFGYKAIVDCKYKTVALKKVLK